MKPFDDYARHYNALYEDKDYAGEAAYVEKIIRNHHPSAKTLLDVGCGTGRHALVFSEHGFAVTGIDRSATMLDEARLSAAQSPAGTIDFIEADIRSFDLGVTFDVAVAMFHVFSYLTTNDDLIAALAAVRRHLDVGGLFVFDFWYGPGVLTERPSRRLKVVHSGTVEVMRFATPSIDVNRNVVTIDYSLVLLDRESGRYDRVNEEHRMRYYFKPEVEFMLGAAGFQLVDFAPWMRDGAPDERTWNAVATARAA